MNARDVDAPRPPGGKAGALAALPATPPKRPRVLGWMTLGLLLAPLVALAIALGALWQGLHTEAGTRWWLGRIAAHVPGLQIGRPEGALLGAEADFKLDRLRLQAGRSTVTIEALRLRGLRVAGWRLAAPFAELQATSLEARRLGIGTQPSVEPAKPAAAPRSLALPIGLRIDALRIDELAWAALPAPIEAIAARVELGADRHRLDGLSARWRGLRAEGQAQVETGGSLAFDARLALRSRADTGGDAAADALPGWVREVNADLRARGPLARFDTQAVIGLRDQRLDARAQITPFDPLPVSQLDARLAKLDLAALGEALAASTALPTTALDGEVLVQLNRDAPLVVGSRLRNAAPGRWDRRRLPLAEIDLLARGSGNAWDIERGQFRLVGDGARPAGQLEAGGRIEGRRLDLALRLRDVRLQALDERAPPLGLGGPLRLRHKPPAAGGSLGLVELQGELEGTQIAAARASKAPSPLAGKAVRVSIAASADLPASRYTVEKLQARSGNARLDGRGRLERAGAAWQAQAEMALADFDPALWWPGDPAAAWRTAGSRLQGKATLEAKLPAAAGAKNAAGWLAALQGRLDARFDENLLAGQPMSLRARAEADGRGALRGDAQTAAAGNRASADFALNLAPGTASAPAGDEQIRLDIDAPALDKLAPIAQAFGLGRVAGRAKLQAAADGPVGAWLAGRPATALRTRGDAALTSLQLGTATLGRAEGRWDLTLPAPGAAGGVAQASRLEAKAELRELRLPGLQLPQAMLGLAGTLASHQASVQATIEQSWASAKPPAPTTRPAAASGDPQARGSSAAPTGLGRLALAFDLDGAWQAAADPAAASVWRARLRELSLVPVIAKGPAASARTATPLLAARDVDLSLGLDAQGQRLTVAPGRAELLGATLRWSRAGWARPLPAGRMADRLELDAEIEPFAVAALLQRLQPDFGWTGDLRVGARATVRSQPAVTARIEVERVSGDLSVQEFDVVQSLGLTALRLDLNVADGLWTATQVIAGDTLGRVAGAQTVRHAGGALWPAADAAVEGAIRLQVDNLSTWGAWVPAGWRLGGTLDGVLTIAGRFGAPELTGTLDGRQLALRNALEGVAWSDGELKARFQGETARLDMLSFKAGEGRLAATGDATLGASAQTRLRVTADRATVLGRVDRRVVASGEARMTLDADALAIDGMLRADEGLIDISRGDAPRLGEDVRVRRAGAAPPASSTEPAPTPTPMPQPGTEPPPRDVRLGLAIDLGQNFRLRGRGIDTRLAGRLQLSSPKGKLAASGEIRTERGSYEAYGQKLAIERGVITFVGDIANPRLDIEAVRANTDTRVGVLVGGSAQAPRVRLFSDPEMPSTEKLALLVTGRSYDSLAGSETLLLQQAAMALLAGDGSETSRFDVARLLQLDQLSVRQSDGSVRDTVVTLGKQISDRVYVGYERGLNAAAGNWQLIYRIARRFTLRAQSGDDPAVDLIWVFRRN